MSGQGRETTVPIVSRGPWADGTGRVDDRKDDLAILRELLKAAEEKAEEEKKERMAAEEKARVAEEKAEEEKKERMAAEEKAEEEKKERMAAEEREKAQCWPIPVRKIADAHLVNTQSPGSEQSKPSEKKHGMAKVIDVCTLERSGVEYPGKYESTSALLATRLGTSTEADYSTTVKALLQDVSRALCLNVTFSEEFPLAGSNGKSDYAVIRLADGSPIGVFEVKKPPKNESVRDVMYNSESTVLGELFDNMADLRDRWGVQEVFGILTTSVRWRVVWLDDGMTNELAAGEPSRFQCGGTKDEKVCAAPLSRRNGPCVACGGDPSAAFPRTEHHGLESGKIAVDFDPVIPIINRTPATDSGTAAAGSAAPNVNAAGINVDAEIEDVPRVLLATEVFTVEPSTKRGDGAPADMAQADIVDLLASALLRMNAARVYPPRASDSLRKRGFVAFKKDGAFAHQKIFAPPREKSADEGGTIVNPFHGDDDKTLADLSWGAFTPANVKALFVLAYLGRGGDGDAVLACAPEGKSVCVLKWRHDGGNVEDELGQWERVYGGGHARVQTWNTRPTLVMRYYAPVTKEQRREVANFSRDGVREHPILEAVRNVLRDAFAENGVKHDDVAWRNVGLYRDAAGGCELKAVLFDLARTSIFESGEDRDVWVNDMVRKLAEEA